MSSSPVLEVSDLRVEFGARGAPGTPGTGERPVRAVDGVSFRLAAGETLGIVGESGSGKSTTALALMRMLPGTGRITSGTARVGGLEVTTAGEEQLREARGTRVAMVFQDPMTALNPVLSVGRQLDEALRAHGGDRGGSSRAARARRAAELLGVVGIPDPARRVADYPHQFSGGMRQRVVIALALANDPDVLLADEPTTALDATVQDQILTLLDRLNRETGTAVVLITHSMGVVARACRRVLVMYGGRVVEDGPTEQVLSRPSHPYTAGLLAAVPRLDTPSGTPLPAIPGTPPGPGQPSPGCAFASRCAFAEVRCGTSVPELTARGDGVHTACWLGGTREPGAAAGSFTPLPLLTRRAPAGPEAADAAPEPRDGREPGAGRETVEAAPLLEVTALRKVFRRGRRQTLVALDGIDLSLAAGETLGIVGESGSGKSTLARAIVGVHPATSGTIRFRGRDVTAATGAALRQLRRDVQMVFQDPYASLNPRMTVGQIIAEPLIAHRLGDRAERARKVTELLTQVGLDAGAADRYPRDFSGGQRQRVGIARALAPEPSVLICDEPVSALDVSVQAQIVNLLTGLQRRLGLTMVFIAHDLAVVRQVSHRIAVMHRGRVVEMGPADEICERPRHAYTRTLLAAAPVPPPLPGAATVNEAIAS